MGEWLVMLTSLKQAIENWKILRLIDKYETARAEYCEWSERVYAPPGSRAAEKKSKARRKYHAQMVEAIVALVMDYDYKYGEEYEINGVHFKIYSDFDEFVDAMEVWED